MKEEEKSLNPFPQEREKNMEAKIKEGLGLDFWAKKLLSVGKISKETFDDFIRQNNSKEELMRERGFPQLKHYGFFSSVKEIREKMLSQKDGRFIIRCYSKETGDIKRLIDASLDEACEFAEKLPGGFDKWSVELKEFVQTKISGTIIVEPSGRTIIETWRGPHYLNTTDCPKYQAWFDPENFDTRFKWTAPRDATDAAEFQGHAIDALRYIFPHLKPRPNEAIYAEYGIKPNGEVYFMETNASPFLTGRIGN